VEAERAKAQLKPKAESESGLEPKNYKKNLDPRKTQKGVWGDEK